MYGLPSIQIAKLQRVQNAAARLIMDVSKYSHITPHFMNFTSCQLLIELYLRFLFLRLR